jgi:hypothetical protein
MLDYSCKPLVSIIIVTWNCRDYVLRCLETVYKATVVPFEVIVRDNGSEDGTAQSIRELYPQVNVLGDSRNIGFAAANNEAIKCAAGEYLLLLNPDAEIPPHTFTEFVNVAKICPKQAVIVPTLLNTDGTVQRSLHSFPTAAGVLNKGIAALKRVLGLRVTQPGIDWVKGACLFIPAQLYQMVGPLDENLFMYGEDLDYCWRVHQAGFDIILAPKIQITHHGNVSGAQKWGSRRLLQTNQTLIYFWVKHFGPFYAILLVLFRLTYLSLYGFAEGIARLLSAKGGVQAALKSERLLSTVALIQACFQFNSWRFYLSGWRRGKS